MTGETRRPNELRFVLFEEEGAWIAMCLEHYVGTQGSSPEEAEKGLKIVYRAELDLSLERTGKPFGDIPPAPERFWTMHQSDDPSIIRKTIYDDGHGAGMGEKEELAA